MKIVVKFFAILRDKAGVSQVELDLPAGSCVSDALQRILLSYPAIQSFLSRAACAVNEQYTPVTTPLQAGDELALIPPVSGG
jgi:molybdopterin converting factor subunit 1